VPEVIKELRKQRAGMVQTASQYIYMHRTICEYIHVKLKEDVKEPHDRFKKDYDRFARDEEERDREWQQRRNTRRNATNQ
jgi:hypothetical protein